MGALVGESGVVRITVALEPQDVDLLDRLAALEDSNRSAELRSILGQLRPVLRSTITAFEAANRARDQLDQAAASASMEELAAAIPEINRMQDTFLGVMARLEGHAAAAAADPRPSNHGGQVLDPPTPLDLPEGGSDE